MKIISCASYYGTGSSAITDLISEYDNVKSFGDFEFSFIHQMNGISDLEYYLVENHHRHNSDLAIRGFLKLAKFCAGNRFLKRYEYYFNHQFMNLTYTYINTLIKSKYKVVGGCRYFYDKGIWYYYFHRLLLKGLKKILGIQKANKLLQTENAYNCVVGETEFLQITRKYIDELLNNINPEKFPIVCLDQIVPSNNLDRYLRYFDDINVIVVERDPRDIYILAKYYWHSTIVPTDDVRVYVDWWRHTRYQAGKNNSHNKKVMYLNFEDLIYRYNETVAKIEKQVGLLPADHKYVFSKFNPKQSACNTQLWFSKKCQADIVYIEKELKDYLFCFDEVKDNIIPGINVKKDVF